MDDWCLCALQKDQRAHLTLPCQTRGAPAPTMHFPHSSALWPCVNTQGAIYVTDNGGSNWTAAVKETVDATLNRYACGDIRSGWRQPMRSCVNRPIVCAAHTPPCAAQPGQGHILRHLRGIVL